MALAFCRVEMKYFALFTILLMSVAASAEASPVVFVLDKTDVIGFGAGPYGQVTLDLMGGGAYAGKIKISVDVTSFSGKTFKVIDTGTHEAFSFNTILGGPFSAPTYTMSGFSVSSLSQAPPSPGTNPGFGSFDLAVQSTCTNPGKCTPLVSSFSFYVGHAGGFSSVNDLVDVTSGSGTKGYFAVDVLCLTGCSESGLTGVVGATSIPNSALVQAPETTTIAMLLVGLCFVITAFRYNRSF